VALGFLVGCGASPAYRYSQERGVSDDVSGDKAFDHVKRLVDFGPRPPGSRALAKSRDYITDALEAVGWEVEEHVFKDQTPEGEVSFVNVRARFRGGAPAADWQRGFRVVIGSHYDTKFYRRIRFVGANDSGSSTGLLLEIARVLAAQPLLAEQIELVFFDGEEAYVKFTPTDGLYGSRAYAAEILRSMPEGKRPEYGLILDMIGEKKLGLTIPPDCDAGLVRNTYQAAGELGLQGLVGIHRMPIIDDHVPLKNVGLKTLNLIDLDYRAWHTSRDTLDQISPDSLEKIGRLGVLVLEKYMLGGGDSD